MLQFVLLLLVTLLSKIEQSDAFSLSFHRQQKVNGMVPYTLTRSSPPSKLSSQLNMETADGESLDTRTEPPRLAYLGLWIGLIAYVYAFAPGGSPEAKSIDMDMIMKLVTTPFDGTITPLYVLVFNSLGVLPAVFASLLLPGGKDQKIPTLPFVGSAFAVGFFGVAPYLGLREINTEVTAEDVAESNRGVFESKIPAVGMLAFFAYLIFYVLSSGDLPQQAEDFADLWRSQALVHVSTFDAIILSLAVWDPLREDKARRVKDSDSDSMLPAWMYCLVPVLGPVVYLLTRPKLPSSS